MGWASYFEDICFRHQDNGQFHEDYFSRYEKAPVQTNAIIRPHRSKRSRTTPALSARFMRLEQLLRKIGSDLTDFYQ